MNRPPIAWTALGVATGVLLLALLYATFFIAPVEARMGIAQKIFYFHVPSAYAMYIGYMVCGVASIGYLVRRRPTWDAWALSGAEVGTLFALVVMVSGPLWARKAWGVWWTWDPRLTSMFLTAMMFAAYLALRSFGSAGAAEKRFAAGLGTMGLLMIPIVHYATKRWGGQHPQVISDGGGGIDSDMWTALGTGFAAFTALALWLLWTRVRIERTRQRVDTALLDCTDLDLGGEQS